MFGLLLIIVGIAVVLYLIWTFVVGTRADTSPDATQDTSGNAFTQGDQQVKNIIPFVSEIAYKMPAQKQGETMMPIQVSEGETALIYETVPKAIQNSVAITMPKQRPSGEAPREQISFGGGKLRIF